MENPRIRNHRPAVNSIPHPIALPLIPQAPPARAARVPRRVAP